MHQKTAIVIGFTVILSTSTTASAQNDVVDSITTSGSGELTTCRSWIVYNACTTRKVVVPERISVGDRVELRLCRNASSVGDRVELSVGSNPKNYAFHITRIRLDGEGCRALSSSSGGDEDGEKLDISHCRLEAK